MVVSLHFWRQFTGIDSVDEVLAHLKTSTHVVWQPSSDWGSTSGLCVLRVVVDVLLHHTPVHVSECKRLVHAHKQQVGRMAVLHCEVAHLILFRGFGEVSNILLMWEWSVGTKFKKILSQLILRVYQAKCAVSCRDNTILGSCFTSESLRNVVVATLVKHFVWEDLIVTLNSHYKCSKV